MLLYRVEDEHGLGPFSAQRHDSKWDKERTDALYEIGNRIMDTYPRGRCLPLHESAELKKSRDRHLNLVITNRDMFYCAARSLDSILMWFPEEFLSELSQYGFFLATYEVDEFYTFWDDDQVCFVKLHAKLVESVELSHLVSSPETSEKKERVKDETFIYNWSFLDLITMLLTDTDNSAKDSS